MGPSGPFPRSKCNFHEGRPRRRVTALVLFVCYDFAMRAAVIALLVSCSDARAPVQVYLAKPLEPSASASEVVRGHAMVAVLSQGDEYRWLLGGCSPLSAPFREDPRGRATVHCSRRNAHELLCVDDEHPPIPPFGH